MDSQAVPWSNENPMGRVKLVSALTLLITISLGLLFEARRYLADTPLTLSKHDIVGDYDSIYDEYFPRYYHATGQLALPFDNIMEPFEAWFAGEHNMSRIDYYGGKLTHQSARCFSAVFIILMQKWEFLKLGTDTK